MQFNSSSTNQDLVSHLNFLCTSDGTNYPIADKTRNINAAYEEVIGDIINSDGTWQYDDTNYTNLPIGTGNLVNNQQTYSFTSEYLQIEAVEVMDLNNRYRRLKQIDHRQLGGLSPDEYWGVDSSGNPTRGFPLEYDIVGDTVFLYPTPNSANVTLTAGIQIYFKRTADLFTTTDTTQEPGLPSTHHVLLTYMAAIPFCMIYRKDRVASYERKVAEMKKSLLAHYAHREKDKQYRATAYIRNFR